MSIHGTTEMGGWNTAAVGTGAARSQTSYRVAILLLDEVAPGKHPGRPSVAGVCNRFLGGRLVESRVTDFISYLLRAEFHSIYTNAGIAAERPRDRDVLDMRDAWTIQAVCASQSLATPARWVWFLPSFDRFRPSVRRPSRPLVRSRPVSDRDRYAILVRKFSNLISPHAHAVACMLDCWLLLIGYRFSACARLSCARRTFCAPP